MSEVLQIPDGKHREWLTQFVVDLVSAKGTTDFTKRLIEETESYRKKQAAAGSTGGKKSKKGKKQTLGGEDKKISNPQAPLKQPLTDPQASSSSISTLTNTIQGTSVFIGDTFVDPVTGEVSDCPF